MSMPVNHLVKLLAVACLSAFLIAEFRNPCVGQDAQEQPAAAAKREMPLGQFVTLAGTIDDGQLGNVKNAALSLQSDAIKQKRKAVLVLELTQGSSEFHQAYGLARFLSSVELSKVTTVAWVPKTVTGHNAIVALACNEIVMHPDAELGDIGRGEALGKDEQQSVLGIVSKVNNLQVSTALAQGMMDPQLGVLKLSLGPAADKITSTRVVTEQRARQMRENKEPILKDEMIWEPGITGKLSGSRARRLDVLISTTAETRLDVKDIYNLSNDSMIERDGNKTNARLIKVEGFIDPFFDQQIRRQIDRALSAGADVLIFEIDSPGGRVDQGTGLANYIADLDPERVRTIAYIPKNAISAAAFVAFGCREMYMHEDAKIGDAGVMSMTAEGGRAEFVPEKMLSIVRADLRNIAEKTHRPPSLLEAMADKDLQIYRVTHRETGAVSYMSEDEFVENRLEWIKGPVVPESRDGNFLIVNGRRANELGIAGPPVQDLDDLKMKLGLGADTKLIVLKRIWIDDLILILNTPLVVFLLLVFGVACLYLELHVNSGFLGILSALCFGIFFWSKFLNGTAGWLEVILFVLGIGCLVMEIFVIPGFGVFGVSGALMVLASLVMASQTFGNLEPNADLHQLTRTMLTLSASIGTVIVMAVAMNRFLPQIPFLNQMILQPPGAAPEDVAHEPRLRPDAVDSGPSATGCTVGQTGEVFADLRPAGKVLLNGDYVDVVSEGPYIGRGQMVEVVSIAGNRIVVREV